MLTEILKSENYRYCTISVAETETNICCANSMVTYKRADTQKFWVTKHSLVNYSHSTINNKNLKWTLSDIITQVKISFLFFFNTKFLLPDLQFIGRSNVKEIFKETLEDAASVVKINSEDETGNEKCYRQRDYEPSIGLREKVILG